MNPEDIEAKSASAGFSLIVDRFPGEGLALRRLFKKSPSFQSLCNDYRECLAALQHWQQSTSEDAPAWRAECAQLLLELEQEVRQYLENQAAFTTDPR
jgi:transposase